MKNWFKNQQDNAFLYVPFIMAFGAALYFCLGFEPNIPSPLIMTIIFGGAALVLRGPIFIRTISIFLFGFCYAMAFTHILNTPQLPHNIHNAQINADVINIEFTTDKPKMYLRANAADIGIQNSDTAIVRVSIPSDINIPNIGDNIDTNVGLFRPAPADASETFDMARWAYFNHISATGYVSEINIHTSGKHTNIHGVRAYLHNRANSVLADGLVLGYKNAIPKSDKAIWTTAGVGHVWAISGFHMALVGGWMFALFLAIFRFITPITRRIPARKVAICASAFGLMGYVLISGASVSTIRAFLMTILVGIAFIIGRTAISLRNVSLVFIIMFLINPHCIMQAGFQLSFAAVMGLIWFWNNVNPKMPNNKFLRIISIAGLTSVIATIFTAPFIILHFNEFPIYGLIGNFILLPIFSIAIMPLTIIGVIMACVGFYWPLNLAQNFYDICLNIATHICNMPAANLTLPFIPNIAMLVIIIGFVALILIRPIRAYIQYIIFAICLCIATLITATYPRPVFIAAADHELVAFIQKDKITFNKARASNHFFTFNTWRKLCGIKSDTNNERFPNTRGVYKFSTNSFNLVYIQKFTALHNNIVDMCQDDNIDYIVSYFDVRAPKCNHKILRDGFIIYESGRIKYTPTRRYWHRIGH